MSVEKPIECSVPMIDPNVLLQPIAAIEDLRPEQREAIEIFLAERCMECVGNFPPEEDFTDLSKTLGLKEQDCFVSAMQATFNAALVADGTHNTYIEEALMCDDEDNHFEPPRIGDFRSR